MLFKISVSNVQKTITFSFVLFPPVFVAISGMIGDAADVVGGCLAMWPFTDEDELDDFFDFTFVEFCFLLCILLLLPETEERPELLCVLWKFLLLFTLNYRRPKAV